MKSKTLWLILCCIFALLVPACENSDDDRQLQGYARVFLNLATVESIPEVLTTLTAEVYAKDMNTITETIVIDKISPIEEPVFDLKIPAGENRVFTVSGLDDNGLVIYQAVEEHDLAGGEITTFPIVLYGQGYIKGVLYDVDADTGDVIGPVSDYAESDGALPFLTDGDGKFVIQQPTRSQTEYLLETVNDDDKFAFASTYLLEPGKAVEIDLFLVPIADIERPWLCAVSPKNVEPGENISLFGDGFEPLEEDGPLELWMRTLEGTTQITEFETQFGRRLDFEMPEDVGSGVFFVIWSTSGIASNEIPFVVPQ